MNLQPLFTTPIVEQVYLDPGYSGHANDIWHVKTAKEEAVVRVPRDRELGGPFWKGCQYLFGLDPQNIFDLEEINAVLARVSPIPVPQVLRKGMIDGRPCVVVEYMPDFALDTFEWLPARALEQLRQALAHIHTHRFTYFGHPTGHVRYELSTFAARISETLSLLVEQFYQHDEQIKAALRSMCEAALQLSPPEDGSLIMIDMDPTQFLTDGERLTALVDTEAYAVGPRELDFIALEYVLDQRGAAALAKGYNAVMHLPDLSSVRPVYRYLYRLIGIQRRTDLETWMAQPVLF